VVHDLAVGADQRLGVERGFTEKHFVQNAADTPPETFLKDIISVTFFSDQFLRGILVILNARVIFLGQAVRKFILN
jgi:hypothetical protein